MAEQDFPPLIMGWSQIFRRPAFRSRSPADDKSSLFLPAKDPVLLTPGASSQFRVTQKSLREHVSIQTFPLVPMVRLSAFIAAGQSETHWICNEDSSASPSAQTNHIHCRAEPNGSTQQHRVN